MKILIDLQTLHTSDRHRGIGRYLRSVLTRLTSLFPDFRLFGCGTDLLPMEMAALVRESKCAYTPIAVDPWEPHGNLARDQYRQAIESMVVQEAVDIYWNPNPLMLNVLAPGKVAGCQNWATVYDLIPIVLPEIYLNRYDTCTLEDYLCRVAGLNMLDGICTISETSCEDLAARTGIEKDRIYTVYAGVEELFFEKASAKDLSEVVHRYGLPASYVFTVGGGDKRKNTSRLIEALAKTETAAALVVTGGYALETIFEMESLAESLGIDNRVIFTGPVPDADLPVLYQAASGFVFPSLYEGFGLPLLEAMASSLPAAAADTPALKEVLAEHGQYFAPENITAMARAIDQLLDPAQKHANRMDMVKRAAAFSWQRVAQATGDAFCRDATLIDRASTRAMASHRSPGRRRVAFFSPLSPQPSGIADYSEALLPHLGELMDIELFIQGAPPTHANIAERFACFDHSEFEDRHRKNRFDTFLYHIGNNTLHAYIMDYLLRYPGVTVLHDSTVHAFLRESALKAQKPGFYLDQLQLAYHDIGALLGRRLEKENFDPAAIGRLSHKFPMNAGIVKKSRAVVVHSRWVRDHLHAGNVHHIPHGMNAQAILTPEKKKALRARLPKMRADDFYIACFGDAVSTKRIEVILRAFSLLKIFCLQAKLLIVGQVPKVMQRTYDQIVLNYGIGHDVIFTHRVHHDDFIAYMQACDVVLNLRYPTQGEMSGSLLHAMAVGKPVLVSDINQFRDFPDDCCPKVRVGEKEQDDLLDHLLTLIQDASLCRQRGLAAQAYIEAHHSWSKAASMYAQIIQHTVEHP